MLYAPPLILWWFIFLPATLAKEAWSCSVPSNATLVPNIALAEAQYGSASYIHGGLVEPWPAFTNRDGRRLRGVRYCFETKETKDDLRCQFWKALGLWMSALGGPKEENGHSLTWNEANNGAADMKSYETFYCYKDMQHIGLGLVWNSKVADDTLVIRVMPESSQSSATVGYKGINEGRHPHALNIGGQASVAVIAHEMGHVLGMIHEHIRNDRDQYVHYRCNNVKGYDDALGRAISMGVSPTDAKRLLCEDSDFAKQYKFFGEQFIKNDRLSTTPDRWGALDGPGGYDIDSIMHYSSYTFGDLEACYNSLDNCPMVQIRKDSQGIETGVAHIAMPVGPSKKDLAWVKANYCWPADGVCG